MSKYTTQLRFICENEAGFTESQGFNKIDDILPIAAPRIFNFYYPIFDNSYKLPLEQKILRHFYTREISEETYGLWKLRLEDKLNMIMPYYNKLYESELLQFNPLYDVDLTSTHSREANSTENVERAAVRSRQDVVNTDTSSTSDTTTNENRIANKQENVENHDDATQWDLYSDTPQGGINGIEGTTGETVENDYYLTNARKKTNEDDNTTSDTATIAENNDAATSEFTAGTTDSQLNTNETFSNTDDREINTLEDYLEHVQGKRSGNTYSRMLLEYRQTFLNIDKMVIEELNDLFFGLW